MVTKKPKEIHVNQEELESVRRLEAAAKTYHPGKGWTPEQEEKLRKFYGRVPQELLMHELKHSWTAIQAKANKMGLRISYG